MTRQERIDAATETLECRVRRLRNFGGWRVSHWLVRRELALCEKGIAAVREAFDSTDDPPPVVIGQGASQTQWPKENSDGTDDA